MKQGLSGSDSKEEIPSSPREADNISRVLQPALSVPARSSGTKPNKERRNRKERNESENEKKKEKRKKKKNNEKVPNESSHPDNYQARRDGPHQDITIIPPQEGITCTPDTTLKPIGEAVEQCEQWRMMMENLRAPIEFYTATVANINRDLEASIQKRIKENEAMLAKIGHMFEESLRNLTEEYHVTASSDAGTQTE
mgnify:CR=1 FL=1